MHRRLLSLNDVTHATSEASSDAMHSNLPLKIYDYGTDSLPCHATTLSRTPSAHSGCKCRWGHGGHADAGWIAYQMGRI